MDVVDSGGSCRHVDVNACLEPACALGTCARDADGDGFSDAWEDNGYVDVDCNGRHDPGVDLAFPQSGSVGFSAVAQSGSGTGEVFPTMTNPADPLAPMSVRVVIADTGRVNAGAFRYALDGGAESDPITIRSAVDLPGNLRLVFGHSPGSNFVAGDTYNFEVLAVAPAGVADRARPNVYVRYDYMGWAAPGAACASDDECIAAGRPNEVCHEGFCNHSHEPRDPLFRKVVESFAAQDVILFIHPVHAAVPHARVTTFSAPGDGTNGATAACAGADVEAGFIGPGAEAVNFHDIKNRPASPFSVSPALAGIYHYAVFGHFNTCIADVGDIGNCLSCPPDRSLPTGFPVAQASGVAELPGNDFIVSMGALDESAGVARNLFNEGGVFMHELGHNLGLHHAGDRPVPENMPNYLSVMNARYTFSGINASATPGSITPDRGRRRIDFSRAPLNPLDESALDEAAGVSDAGSGNTDIVRFFDCAGTPRSGAGAGAIDWNGNGVIDAGTVQVDLNLDNGGCGNGTSVMPGFADWDHGTCASREDCPVNLILSELAGHVPTRAPCCEGRCRTLIYPFQCQQWGAADGPAPLVE